MKLHLVALPHTTTERKRFTTCAYTSKINRLCRMLENGWEIILYGSELNDAPCAEHVTLIDEDERIAWFGDGFDTTSDNLSWDPSEPYWQVLNGRAVEEISRRVSKRDLILLSTGSQALVMHAFPKQIVCEWTVGYLGICTPYCAFESSSFMHEVYARQGIDNGRDFDAVIPNYFDPDEFPIVNQGDGDYLLYLGRITYRKGIGSASDLARAAGMKLVMAGPGVTSFKKGRLVGVDATIEDAKHIEYVGEVGIEGRAELMAGAYALLAPTQYLEPFGGVAVEAQMCGTPALTTDFGAFRETVHEEFRYRTLQQGLDAFRRAGEIDHEQLREDTIARYSLEAVKPRFEEWFRRLDTLWDEGWYQLTEKRAKIALT